MVRRLLFHNFRVVYGISLWLRRRFTPGGQLVLGTMVAAVLFGINTRLSLAYQVFTLSAALLIVALCSSLRPVGGLRVQRLLPEYGSAGLPLRYRIRIDNPGTGGQTDLSLNDELQEDFPSYAEFCNEKDPDDRHRNWVDRWLGYPRLMGMLLRRRGAAIDPIALPDIAARDRADIDLEIMPRRRGYLRFMASTIARPDPLGLFRALRSVATAQALLILPRLYRVAKLRLGGRRKYQRGGMTLASGVGDSQEFQSLREYRPGDPLRAIHWRSFAKTGVPVVREFQEEYFVRQALLLDTFIEERPEALFEEAVSVAASFAASLRDSDTLLDLMFVGAQAYRFTSGRGLGSAAKMLEVLACVEPVRGQGIAPLRQLMLRHAGETSSLMCVLLDWDSTRRELLRDLNALGIPIIAFVLTLEERDAADDTGVFSGAYGRVHFLPVGRVQEALDAATGGVSWAPR